MATASFLRNRYWILRHGKSIPNEKGLIVSSIVCDYGPFSSLSTHLFYSLLVVWIENGILPEYQLDPEGVEQARLAGIQFLKELKENSILLENVRICYSPFSRTIHTAKVAASVLNLPFEDPQCKMIENLRERYFGPSFELSSHEKYEDIWALDEEDPFKRPEGGESVEDVASRLAQAILEIESLFQGCAILVVSHGDPLQIFQAMMGSAAKQDGSTSSNDLSSIFQALITKPVLSNHRQFALLTGELRPLP
ncbi:metal-independent phosphoserine phosphatase [Cucumis melo var. makuwa]|nr:metal-independent phosphoserine phosphatase [Cucumis melo var. makuwa]